MATSTRERRGAAPARAARPATGAAPAEAPRFRGPAWLDGPMTTSHLLLGSAGLLLVIGLVMVFSASSIEAAIAGQPAWLPGVRQIAFALLGLLAMLVAMHLPIGRIRQWSGRGMLVAFALLLLVLVPGIGLKLNGARAWFDLGFTNFQPSELAKLVFALWGAHVIATREKYLTTRSLLVPVLPVFVLMSLLLLAEPDMGAVVSLGLVVAGLMWAGGLSRRYIAGAVGVAAVLLVLMVKLAPYRMARITGFLDPFADPSDGGYQAIHGFYALASGGVWGVGLGNSAMKWNLLPHAESDYIFAIIGEELGFLGCLVVVGLYAILAWAGFRISRRSTDRFVQLASIAITVWLIGQATMNMGYVVGVLPVTGVTLPLISAGGTSLVLTLFIVGLLARFARAEPAAIAHQRSLHRGRFARLFMPVPPAAVDPAPSRRRRAGGRDTGRDGRLDTVPSGTTRGTRRTPVRADAPHGDGRMIARVPGLPAPRPGDRRGVRPEDRRGVRLDDKGRDDGGRDDRSRVRPADRRGDRAGDPRAGRPGHPDERPGGPERQTGAGRPSAGDRPTVLRRTTAAAGPDVPRERGGAGEPAAARVRPVQRSRPPRTERPGRQQ